MSLQNHIKATKLERNLPKIKLGWQRLAETLSRPRPLLTTTSQELQGCDIWWYLDAFPMTLRTENVDWPMTRLFQGMTSHTRPPSAQSSGQMCSFEKKSLLLFVEGSHSVTFLCQASTVIDGEGLPIYSYLKIVFHSTISAHSWDVMEAESLLFSREGYSNGI